MTTSTTTLNGLKPLIGQHLSHAIPLHLPTCRFCEAAHNTHRSQLHNDQKWEEALPNPARHTALPCACQHLKTFLLTPNHPTIDGHYILTLSDITLPQHLRMFLDASMNSTFFPSKKRYCDTFHTAFRKWLRTDGLPPSLIHHSEAFLQQQWRQHLHQLDQQPKFIARLLRQLQEHLGDHVVLHHADHELQQLRVFCP